MGYDMSIRNYDGTDLPGLSYREDPTYYRLNIWGMGWMRGVMEQAGVLDFDAPFPQWPDHPGEEHFNYDEDLGDRGLTPEGRAYEEACEAVRSAPGREGKVAGWKFGTNDGWLVTPDECRSIAQGLRDLLESGNYTSEKDDDEKYIKSFADYCERAAEHGEGFEVW